ncbi:MAG: hypothetical protein PVJ49_06055 [Acidobacteriota bacterium]|jgi:hypothetical protein
MDVEYSHQQLSPLVLVLGGVFGLIIGGALITGGAIVAGLWVVVVCVLVVSLFFRLCVEIRRRELRVRFGIGLIQRTFAVSQLVAARPVRNKWYYGWGIRWTPHGWLFNVYGLDAVEIKLRSGKRYRIGTNDPERLNAALQRAMAG